MATIDLLEQRRSELVEVCPRFQVESLEVFGSAAVGPWDPAEAISIFSCNFSPLWHGQLFDNFFDLKIEPQNLFGRNVDLVLPRSIRNPYFLASVNRTRQALYAA